MYKQLYSGESCSNKRRQLKESINYLTIPISIECITLHQFLSQEVDPGHELILATVPNDFVDWDAYYKCAMHSSHLF